LYTFFTVTTEYSISVQLVLIISSWWDELNLSFQSIISEIVGSKLDNFTLKSDRMSSRFFYLFFMKHMICGRKWRDLFHCIISKFFVVLACWCPVCDFITDEYFFWIDKILLFFNQALDLVYFFTAKGISNPSVIRFKWWLGCVNARLHWSWSGQAKSPLMSSRIVLK
jgi:hypothetical protein